MEYEMMVTYSFKDIARKQPQRVIFALLVHLRVETVILSMFIVL